METSNISYYSVHLHNIDGSDIFAELSGVSRAGIMRINFPIDESYESSNSASQPYASIQVTRQGHNGQVTINPQTREIYGYNPERQDSNLGPDKASNFKGYFVARFEESFATYGIAKNTELTYNETFDEGELLSAFVTFPSTIRQVTVRMGVSYISIEQARRNLDQEIPSTMTLEEVVVSTAMTWSEKLDRVTLYNATDVQNEIFYSAMFHALQVSMKNPITKNFMNLMYVLHTVSK
jgi:putative alpha-1,2-mannosidase